MPKFQVSIPFNAYYTYEVIANNKEEVINAVINNTVEHKRIVDIEENADTNSWIIVNFDDDEMIQ